MAKISLLFVGKLGNSGLLPAFSALIRKNFISFLARVSLEQKPLKKLSSASK